MLRFYFHVQKRFRVRQQDGAVKDKHRFGGKYTDRRGCKGANYAATIFNGPGLHGLISLMSSFMLCLFQITYKMEMVGKPVEKIYQGHSASTGQHYCSNKNSFSNFRWKQLHHTWDTGTARITCIFREKNLTKQVPQIYHQSSLLKRESTNPVPFTEHVWNIRKWLYIFG